MMRKLGVHTVADLCACPKRPESRRRRHACTLNNITAKKDAGASITVRFGGCDGKIVDCLPTVPG